MREHWNISLVLLFFTFYIVACNGSYIITVPKEWQSGGHLQVCVQVSNSKAPAGDVSLSIVYPEDKEVPSPDPKAERKTITIEVTEIVVKPTAFKIPAGSIHHCENLPVPSVDDPSTKYYNRRYNPDRLLLTGNLDGVSLNHTSRIIRRPFRDSTFIQTDKALYQPGQQVQFRVLTVGGPLMTISTDNYPEVYVTTPSRTRIAQWLDVDNSKGLVHLSMQLADEPEEGTYKIHIKENGTEKGSSTFKVEEYVLPRFEVTVKPPNYVLRRDSHVSFTACARYTFGQPVPGNITWKLDNQQSRGCSVELIKNDTIAGCAELKVAANELKLLDCTAYRITATATVTEEGTGVEATGSADVTVNNRDITFETLRQDAYKKPNLPYTLKVQAQLPDDSPAVGEELEVCYGGACSNYTSSSDGVITVYLTNDNNRKVVIQKLITRAGMSSSQYVTHVSKFFSPSNSSLLIYAPEEKIACQPGQDVTYKLPVVFASNGEKEVTINVQVLSRGQIQHWSSELYTLSSTDLPFENKYLLEPLEPTSKDIITGLLNIPLTLPSTVSPQIKVLVWYVRKDGEVVSDSMELDVEKCLPNHVSLNWSTNKTQPGDPVTLELSSEGNSICSLGVVDKSVELLGGKKDTLTLDTLFQTLNKYDISRWSDRQVNDNDFCRKQLEKEIGDGFYSYYSDYVDALQTFDETGVYIFSDLQLETRPCEKEEQHFISTRIGVQHKQSSRPRPAADSISHAQTNRIIGGDSLDADAGNTPRTDFPETWLWDLVTIPSSGVSSQDLYLPDSITEWIGNAVCVHPEKGVGLSEKVSITTFSPFFIDLTLPPSVKRGEILPIKISVFNYLAEDLPVTVSLERSLEYDIMENETNSELVSSCIKAQGKVVHTIKVRPNIIGQMNLTVTAYVDSQTNLSCALGSVNVIRRDSLIKPITVEAEGFLREKTWSKYICAEETQEDDIVELTVPSGMVESSERAWVNAVGDLLSLSLQNLGHLIRMPYGCGEQNMINFAPNVFIMKYLLSTRQNTTEATEKLSHYMRTGYQRQLLYRHHNGSYSAFGNADSSGSTWLTAFVLKSFSHAQDFILVDEESIDKTMQWLIESYGPHTCAVSHGKVFNKGLKGGIGESTNVPLTAYILISLLESGVHRFNDTIQKGVTCLLTSQTNSPYTLSLMSYALSLAIHTSSQNMVEQLLSQAVETKNSMYWDLSEGSNSWNSNSLAVETAGYAILAMIATNFTHYEPKARKVVKWISTQRNGQGGFYSTQDTVVALQALAFYEMFLHQDDLNVTAKVKSKDLSYTIDLNESNKFLQQMVTLPTLPTNVSLSMSGKGCAFIQTVLRYNDPNPDASEAFDLRVNTRTEPDHYCVTKRISVCASYLLPDGVSNMAIIEVNLVSGYIPEKIDLKRIVFENPDVVKRYEVDGSKVSFYIEEFTSKDTCVNFRVTRVVDVEDVKPGSVTVYDYYQPEFLLSETYNLPPNSECQRKSSTF